MRNCVRAGGPRRHCAILSNAHAQCCGALPALVGGLFVTAIYALICLVYAALLPGIFERVWHTEALFDRSVAGIPLEELLYGLASGALATAALPAVTGQRYLREPRHESRGR